MTTVPRSNLRQGKNHILGFDAPAFNHFAEKTLPGHDTIAGQLFDGTAAVMTLLADLGYFQNHCSADLQAVAEF
jgi:hypothetical protein